MCAYIRSIEQCQFHTATTILWHENANTKTVNQILEFAQEVTISILQIDLKVKAVFIKNDPFNKPDSIRRIFF